jgi:hypothetical protein
MGHVKLSDFPVIMLATGLAFEIVRAVLLRRRFRGEPLGVATWFVRPWTLWAAFNLVFRLRWSDGFNNRHTFPFFAYPWDRKETWSGALHRLLEEPSFAVWSMAALAGGLLTMTFASRMWKGRGNRALTHIALYGLGVALPLLYAAVPCGIERAMTDEHGFLAPWFRTGGTMLHCMPYVRGVDHYIRNFEAIQPNLEISMHGLSHPPLASLSLHWLGQMTGAEGLRTSVESDRVFYAFALTGFNALAIPAMYVFGRAVFADPRVGLMGALLWLVKPAALAHNTFAQDGVYTVFFILTLTQIWRTGTAARVGPFAGLWLGATFLVLSQLTFSWCIAATIFALFAALRGASERWPAREWFWRVIWPLSVFGVLFVAFCAHFGLDYLHVYRTAAAYVNKFYKYENAYQWTMALIGGQLALLLMLGSVVASMFCARVLPAWRATRSPAVQFALVSIGVYLVPIVIGPNCLKMETERCWSWITALPLAFVARELSAARGPGLALAVVGLNLAQYYVMRLFICILS